MLLPHRMLIFLPQAGAASAAVAAPPAARRPASADRPYHLGADQTKPLGPELHLCVAAPILTGRSGGAGRMTTLVVEKMAGNFADSSRPNPPVKAASAGDLLIARAQAGDRSAQAALFEQLQDVWFRFCVSILGDSEAAREAVQETAFRFLQRLGSFRGDSQLKTWALGIALNVCRELTRKANRPLGADEFAARPDTKALRPDEAAGDAEQCGQVRQLVDQLPPRQREAMVLRYFEQLDIEQTAQVMGCAVGTVKATVSQALKSLRRKYEHKS